MADEIIIKYGADIAGLETKLNKLEKDLLDLQGASKEGMGSVEKESKKAASGVDKVDKKVKTLGDSFSDLASKLPFASSIQQVTEFGSAVSNTGTAAVNASKGMNILKIATVAALGPILLIVTAVISLIAYFKRTDEGATKLEGIMGALGAVIGEVTGFIAELGGKFFDALSSMEGFQQGIKDLGQAILDNLINRFKAVLVYGEAIGLLFEGKFSEAAIKAGDATIQLTFGITDASKKFTEFQARVSKAAEEAYQFALAMDAISDAQRELNVQLSENRIRIVELIKQSKNHSRTIEERINLLKEANKLDEDGLKQTLVLEEKKLALFQERNKRELAAINQGKSLIVLQLAEAKTDEERIKLKTQLLSINDDLADEEANQQIKINNLKAESVALQERNNNAIAALLDQDAKENADRLEKERKAREDHLKHLLDLEKEFKALSEKEFQDTLAIRKEEYAQAENLLKESLLNNEITIEQYNEAVNKLQQSSLERQKVDYEDYVKNVTGLEGQILDAKLKAKKADEEAEKALQKKKLELQKQASSQALDIIGQVQSAGLDNKLREETSKLELEKSALDKSTENQINALTKRREAGLISEEEFNKQKAKIDIKKAQDELKIKQKQFKAQQDADVNRVKSDTAVAIVKTFASLGFLPAAFIAVAGLAATAAIQIATIRNAQPPKFEDGGKINGKSHKRGGVIIEAEGGEWITDKHNTRKYEPALEAMTGGYFDKFVNSKYVVPAMRKAEERERLLRIKSASTGESIMNALGMNGFGDMSHLERLTKANKKVIVQNLDGLPKEIGNQVGRVLANKNYMK